MRFHPVIDYLKKHISKKKFDFASISCTTNLKNGEQILNIIGVILQKNLVEERFLN